jgi:hypothetical protein
MFRLPYPPFIKSSIAFPNPSLLRTTDSKLVLWASTGKLRVAMHRTRAKISVNENKIVFVVFNSATPNLNHRENNQYLGFATVPEIPIWITLPLLLSVLSVAVILMHRKNVN